MASEARTITPRLARRVAIARQQLAGPVAPATEAGILSVLREIRCLQLDPISAVARSPLLVLWSRLGSYDSDLLSSLLWQERVLFEYWAHAASIVLSEDFPLFRRRMEAYRNGGWHPRTQKWLAENEGLRRHVLARLATDGPLVPAAFDQESVTEEWHSTGWTNRRTVNQMLGCLWTEGHVLIAGREGRARLWNLAERCLPEQTAEPLLPEGEAVRRSVQLSLRALGVGTARHIREHFMRKGYPGLTDVLDDLEAAGTVAPLQLAGAESEKWYIHREDLPLLESLDDEGWQPRTTLLSPFDNLICDRARTEQLFDFRFRLEIYVPKDKREFGYYVLPILHGDRLIGRLDPKLDRKTGRLQIHALYAEADAPRGNGPGRAIADAIGDLARFVGASDVVLPREIPAGWQAGMAALTG